MVQEKAAIHDFVKCKIYKTAKQTRGGLFFSLGHTLYGGKRVNLATY